uniref:substrate-binding domain-containing protein n=1 Tax=Microbacterium schleiferi TaxID=69362 RepID=UPI0035C86C1E
AMAAAEALGYTGPDPRAASLRRGRSGIVGVVFGGSLRSAFHDPVTIAMMDGIAEGVAPLRAGLLLLPDEDSAAASATGEEGDPAELPSTMTTAPIDAAVLVGFGQMRQPSLDVLRARRVPVVIIEGDAGPDIPRIELDNAAAQHRAASYLRDLGHERVTLLTLPIRPARARGWFGPADAVEVDVTAVRLAGAREVYPDAPTYAAVTSSIDEGLIAGREILAQPDRPTAVIAQTDLLAAGVIRAAEECGLRVPEDLSVTGFDGVEVDGLDAYELTTLVQPAVEKGRAAGAAVVAMLAGDEAASVTFTCTFRTGTTAAPVSRRESRGSSRPG